MRKILLILIMGLAFSACGEKDDDTQTETPDDWEDTVNLFDDYTATVKGVSLLPSEWNGVANKVATAIIGAFPANPTTPREAGQRTVFRNVFGDNDVVIIVEKTTAYKCKVDDGEFKTFYLSLNYLNDTGLRATITAAVEAMGFETAGGYKLE